MAVRIFPWIIFAVAFVLIVVFYESLPSSVVITKGIFGGPDIVAAKSPFTAVRVVLIDLVCAFAIEIMRRRSVSVKLLPDHERFWLILLFTAAFKSLFQTLELVSVPGNASFYAVLAVVVTGVALAGLVGRKLISNFDRSDWKLTRGERLLLGVCLTGYLVIAIGPIMYFR
jgi:hypothetical protein